jgi:hypothetical protein
MGNVLRACDGFFMFEKNESEQFRTPILSGVRHHAAAIP